MLRNRIQPVVLFEGDLNAIKERRAFRDTRPIPRTRPRRVLALTEGRFGRLDFSGAKAEAAAIVILGILARKNQWGTFSKNEYDSAVQKLPNANALRDFYLMGFDLLVSSKLLRRTSPGRWKPTENFRRSCQLSPEIAFGR
ncbi:MAG TPA: hypothetical protein VFQ60_04635 [Patescibacteria group bacterium]|nr:hypothetical protein [Patescibacteria group bacterium]